MGVAQGKFYFHCLRNGIDFLELTQTNVFNSSYPKTTELISTVTHTSKIRIDSPVAGDPVMQNTQKESIIWYIRITFLEKDRGKKVGLKLLAVRSWSRCCRLGPVVSGRNPPVTRLAQPQSQHCFCSFPCPFSWQEAVSRAAVKGFEKINKIVMERK